MSLIDMRIDVDDCFHDQINMYHRRSNSMPFVFLDIDDWNPDAFSKLSDEPLRLSVLKLDGTSFDIAVTKSATVADLKEAVEHVFSFVPRKGPGKISWPHVWGNFCLCFDGMVLATENDPISEYGIADGDQLEFVRHDSRHQSTKKSLPRWFSAPDLRRITPLLSLINSTNEREEKDKEVYSYDEAENGRCHHDAANEMDELIIQQNGFFLHLLSKLYQCSRLLPTKERVRISEPRPPRSSSCGTRVRTCMV